MAFDYINALLKKEVTRTPIWVMRQAGRYLPEYRATRKKAGDFLIPNISFLPNQLTPLLKLVRLGLLKIYHLLH